MHPGHDSVEGDDVWVPGGHGRQRALRFGPLSVDNLRLDPRQFFPEQMPPPEKESGTTRTRWVWHSVYGPKWAILDFYRVDLTCTHKDVNIPQADFT